MDEKMEVSSDSRMKFLEEGRLLPWRLVGYATWTKLANKLDLQSPVSNNDWRGLAEHLGFSTEDILLLESNNTQRKTIALFTNFMPQSDATVNKVAHALKQMNRDDALQILLDAIPDIEERYLAEQQQKSAGASGLEPVETDDHCMNSLPQVGCQCLASPTSLHLSSHHGGGCSPCSAHSQCNIMSGGCCCRRIPVHHVQHCHSPPIQCSPHRIHSPVTSHPHLNPLATSTLTSTMIHPTIGNGGTVMSTTPLKYNIVPGSMQHPSSASMPKTHMAEGGLYGPESLALHSQHSSSGGLALSGPQQQHSLHQQRLRQQLPEGGPPIYGRSMAQADSMAVHPDPNCHESALQSFSSVMETDGAPSEEPAPLPNAIARGQGRLMSGLQPLPMDVSLDDEPSTTTEELSSSDSITSIPNNGVPGSQFNIRRQVSEECNAKQPYSSGPGSGMSSAHRNNLEASGMLPSAPPAKRQTSSPWPGTNSGGARAGGEMREKGGGRLGGSGGRSPDEQSSLHHLVNLAKLPDRYMPDSKYTTIVAEQQIDDIGPLNGKRGPSSVKRERDLGRPCHDICSESTDNSTTSSRSGGSSSSRSRSAGGENPHTFPMRVKPQAGGLMVEDVRRLQPGQLTKTVSVPVDMKVEEFRKAFRHIKVFVTYANDSKHHSRQVLSLCNCLDRNGFSCCVDVYSSQEDSQEKQQASRDWCSRKFREADFVLVCISPQYLHEIEMADNSTPPANGAGSSGLLHAACIYQLMQDEFHRTGRCSRFVPLYFEGSSNGDGPSWLTRQLVYQWPRQYKDLLWMLTKPEERIKQRTKPGAHRNHSTASLNGHRSLTSSVH